MAGKATRYSVFSFPFAALRPGSSSFVLLASIVLFAIWLCAPSGALAHAKLARSEPPAGSILDAPPSEIRLYLSEAVSIQYSTIKLYDRSRTEQPIGPIAAANSETEVRVGVTGRLAPGTYTVVWRVVSVDGHLTAGSLAFRVRGAASGTLQPDEPVVPLPTGDEVAPLEGSAQSADPIRWVVRSLILAAAALLVGGALFTVGVIEPSAREVTPEGPTVLQSASRRFGLLGVIAASVLFVGLVVDLLFQVATITGSDFLGALARGDQALALLSATRYGFAWGLKALAALSLLAVMLFVWRLRRGPGLRLGPTPWDLTAATGALFLLAEALSSHAAAATADHGGGHALGLPVPIVSDWLHLATASMWVGGLAYIAVVLYPSFREQGVPPDRRRALLARTVPRFSRLAILSVALLAITGVYNLIIRTTDLAAILNSSYGQLLALKVGIFAVLVAIGATNWRRISPLLRGMKTKGPELAKQWVSGGRSGVKDQGSKANEGQTVTGNSPSPITDHPSPDMRLLRNVQAEVILAVVVLLCAGGLTLLPPPSATGGAYAGGAQPTAGPSTPLASSSRAAQRAPATPQPATAATQVAGYEVALTTRPSIERDELTLRVTRMSEAAPPLTDVARVLFKVSPQDVDAGSTSYPATLSGEAGPDTQIWTATEPILTLDGGYLITTIVQRTESPDIKAAFRLDLSLEGGLRASPAQMVEVRLSTEPSPPISGTTNLLLTLVDGAGEPITDATITINPFMPAHAHVEPTGVAAPVPGRPGVYTMPVNFVMTGPWLLIFNVERPGTQNIKTDASIDVMEDPNATPAPINPTTPIPSATP